MSPRDVVINQAVSEFMADGVLATDTVMNLVEYGIPPSLIERMANAFEKGTFPLREANGVRASEVYQMRKLSTPAQWFQALIGELGEYANLRNKYKRGDITLEERIKHAEKALADAQTYLDLILADETDTTNLEE